VRQKRFLIILKIGPQLSLSLEWERGGVRVNPVFPLTFILSPKWERR